MNDADTMTTRAANFFRLPMTTAIVRRFCM
jgi:hypothetical protein